MILVDSSVWIDFCRGSRCVIGIAHGPGYHRDMRVTTGTVVAGKVVLDDPSITYGTYVLVVTREREEAVRLSPEEVAELEAGIAEADRGETISGEELFARLRRHQ